MLAGGFHDTPGKFELTVPLTRIMYPFILLVSLAALAMGMLNAKNIFGAPAMASSFFNLGSIVGGVTLAWWLDPHFAPEHIDRALVGMAFGTLLGGFLQFAVQLPPLLKVGYRFQPDFRWRDEGVRTDPAPDGAGGHRSERGADQRAGQLRFRQPPGQRRGGLAEQRRSA